MRDFQQPRTEFSDVDQALNPNIYIQLLDAQLDNPFTLQYKQHAQSLLELQPGLLVLDAGSGTGEDVRLCPPGRSRRTCDRAGF
ncbi:hypothetical protein [Dictyobacter kobayashii]|uniref:Uncharacterized protein n=1 Tax=Dictyobacter kobayashii TaxID=2014872 RepID=A0A402AR48_9CHLR|nr:hypothetical protein [Dictyobacter kobayashii]GCE21571.1 hypothetical protein KDK_53710 [Dictyobacter kobayashii]